MLVLHFNIVQIIRPYADDALLLALFKKMRFNGIQASLILHIPHAFYAWFALHTTNKPYFKPPGASKTKGTVPSGWWWWWCVGNGIYVAMPGVNVASRREKKKALELFFCCNQYSTQLQELVLEADSDTRPYFLESIMSPIAAIV